VSSASAIAIVGASCRFDGAADPAALWRRLLGGEGLLRTLDDDALRAAGLDPAKLPAGWVRVGGVLPDIESIDLERFGLAAREASLIDPQHRLFLELALEALEDAGCDPDRIAGPIGVFGGAAFPSYLTSQLMPSRDQLRADDELAVMIGNNKDHLASRVAFLLGLRGPAVNVQTACSTSLMAVHLACQSLLQGECDLALAGGVSIEVPQGRGYGFSAGGVLAPDGRCRAFDADAAGTVPGNGGGMVLLRPLDAALRDGDRILAVIEASAANNDGGGKMAYTAPSVDGQASAIAEALALADVDPAAIGYVETHGTGTPLGDPIEIAALRQAFAERPAGPPCLLGAVKTHLGHCDAAAGIAGLLAAALAVEAGEVPPVRHFRRANPRIDFGPFQAAAERRPWPAIPGPRRAGVSSFGMGGTNVHAIVAQAPPRAALPASVPERRVFLLSASTPAGLAGNAERLADHLLSPAGRGLTPADVAATLAGGRVALGRRRAVVADDADDLVAALRDPARWLEGTAAAGRHGGRHRGRRVAFLFPGQGAQRPGMAAGLETLPAFADTFGAGLERLRTRAGLDLGPLLRMATPDAGAALERTEYAQSALVLMGLALAAQWRAWGVIPKALLGHSVGELAAACLAGIFEADAVFDLVAERGRLLAASGPGAMAAVPLPAAELGRRLAGTGLEIAAINGERLCSVSGPAEELAIFVDGLQAEGIAAKRLQTAHAFHSAAVESAMPPFRQAVAAARPKAPRIPILSNVTGTWLSAAEATDPDYWARHLRATVRFADGLTELAADRPLLIELGPGQGLTALARGRGLDAVASSESARASDIGRRADTGVRPYGQPSRHSDLVGTDPHVCPPETGADVLLAAAGRAWTLGAALDARGLCPGGRKVPLPTYAFERRRCWIESGPAPAAAKDLQPAGDLRPNADTADWLYAPTWTRRAGLAHKGRTVDGLHWLIADPGDAVQRRLADALAAELVRRSARVARWTPGDAAPTEAPTRAIHLGALGGSAAAIHRDALEVVRAAAPFAKEQGGVALVAVVDRLHDVQGEEARRPEQAVVLGPWRVAPQEIPGLSTRLIDADLGRLDAAPEALAAALLDLAAEGPEAGDVVALRGDPCRPSFWRAGFEKIDAPSRTAAWGEKSVVVITGGLGRMGRALGGHLASQQGARVVLLGRRPADAALQAWADALSMAGPGEVTTALADVAAPGTLRGALAAVAGEYGRIDAVIHAAGITGDLAHTPLLEIGDAERERHFAPKITGGDALAEAVAALRADGVAIGCVLLCSSLSTVLGGLGFAAYAGANAYLDALAGLASRRTGTPWLAVDWDGWRFGEAAAPASGAASLALDPEQGLALFDRLPAFAPLGRLVVSTADLARRQARWVGAGRPEAKKATPASGLGRPASAPEYQAPTSATEELLAAVWADVLGFAPIGGRDSFFELGGHSLLATQMVSRLRERAGAELPMAAIFDHPTLAGLARFLDQLSAALPEETEDEEREVFEL
jgi:phthiocerol/phenolphthiocerol synthesis type-I polyketide synthase E